MPPQGSDIIVRISKFDRMLLLSLRWRVVVMTTALLLLTGF